ncbi:MAG TPA: YkoF family thiamine/hydroxymethylpyrimidine-binding protein [Saprospiraceae bacterium]|nr:YkoF family thiamine/hydroxymethylpyrimidine-binding protein [Saprospiraceae bacterium]
MIVTIEISHYPLKDEYEQDVLDFIQYIKSQNKIQVYTNAMSTYMKGDIHDVLELVKKGLLNIYSNGNPSSTVLKIIPRSLPVEDGYLEW